MEDFILDNINFRLLDILGGEDKVDYIKLHNLLFPGMNIDSKWIKWYHQYLYRTRTYGAYDTKNDKLIGIWSVEPRKFFDGSKILSIGRCFAVGIHPDYRRQGIFVDLSKYALQCEKNLKQFDYIVGFPQVGRDVIGGHLKAGWYTVQTIKSYCLENKDINKNSLEEYSAIHVDSFYNLDYIEIPGSFVENSATKQLRWLEHPDNAYFVFQHNHSFIVLKPYKNICHVLDVQGPESATLLYVAKKLCKTHNWEALTIWCADNEEYGLDIANVGFCPSEEYMKSIQMIAYNINAKENLKLEICHIQTGIEEQY